MVVVSNASPIISLAIVGRLDLLPQVYQHIVIPQAVADELAQQPGRPGADPAHVAWLTVQVVQDRSRVATLQQQLHPGEAEAIALALELPADILLMDERRGRHIASTLGIDVTGVLGTLIAAKRQGILPQVRPVLDDLIQRAGFRVAPHLYQRVVQLVGEQP
jgi:hypothetical protein